LRLSGKRRGAALDLSVSAGNKRPKRQRRRASEPDHFLRIVCLLEICPLRAAKLSQSPLRNRQQSASRNHNAVTVLDRWQSGKNVGASGQRRAEEREARRIEHPFCVAAGRYVCRENLIRLCN
jgi:hypothetical protein